VAIPQLALAADNTVFVGWTARVDSDSGYATDLYLSSSRDNGQTFGVAMKVNDDTKPAVHGMHSLVIGAINPLAILTVMLITRRE
jgi:hypothetical protein